MKRDGFVFVLKDRIEIEREKERTREKRQDTTGEIR